MESVDHTPRRHIGYHKGSKSHIPPFDRSSSCPSYASPSHHRQKSEKKKIDLFPHITNVLSFLRHNASYKDDEDSMIVKENIALIRENEQLMKSLADYDANNEDAVLNTANNIGERTGKCYNNGNDEDDNDKDYDDNDYDQTKALYESLCLENHRLQRELGKCKERNNGLNYNSKSDVNFKKMFPYKKMGKLLNEVKSNMTKFITFYNNSDPHYTDYDNDFNNNYNFNDEDYNPQRSHHQQSHHNNTYNFHNEKDYPFYQNDNNPSNDHVFECDENANITNNDDDVAMDNVIITTEKFEKEKENGNEVIIALDHFKMKNKAADVYTQQQQYKSHQYLYQHHPLHHSNNNIKPQSFKGATIAHPPVNNLLSSASSNNKRSQYSNNNSNTNTKSNTNLNKNDINRNTINMNIKTKTKVQSERFSNNNPMQRRRFNNNY